MIILSGFLLKFYLDQKNENSALRIKLITMSVNKRTPTTWRQLTTKTAVKSKSEAAPLTTTAPANTSPQPKILIADMPLEALVSELNSKMKEVRSLDAVTLDRNVLLADEIISREPASYSAYKAKLISLLVKEGKHKAEIEDTDVDSLLETMAGFDVTTDSVTRKEAALLTNANNQLSTLQEDLMEISNERIQIDEQLQLLAPESEERAVLEEQRAEFMAREANAGAQLEQFESTTQTSLEDDSYLNEDVVEIPFMRLLAKNEFDSVIDNAESFIEQFPTSVSGYYYLIKGMEFQGRNEDVAAVIASSQLSPDALQTLQSRLDQTKGSNPKNYWERLSF